MAVDGKGEAPDRACLFVDHRSVTYVAVGFAICLSVLTCGCRPPSSTESPGNAGGSADANVNIGATESTGSATPPIEVPATPSGADGDGTSGNARNTSRPASIATLEQSLPTDDPANQGWQIEPFADEASERLKHIDAWILAKSSEPPDWVADEFRSANIRPDELTLVYAADQFEVRRGGSAKHGNAAKEFIGPAGFAQACRRWLSEVVELQSLRVKIKVFGVELAADGKSGRTDAYVQLAGVHTGGTIQVNTTWQCDWLLDSQDVKLASVDVTDYEEVVNHSGSQSLFRDYTDAILAGPVFRDQLRHGVDHWLPRVESSLGIDIGGWQGLAVGDVNGDGLEDVYICQPGGLPNRLYIQQPDGTALESSHASGVDFLESSHAALIVDLDNDFDQDMVVGVSDGVVYLSNNGRGRFHVRAALPLPSALPYSMAAADYDVDGDLDVYVCCYNRRSGVNRHLLFARPVPYHDANNGGRNTLLRTQHVPRTGDWSIRFATNKAGLEENNHRFSYAAAWEDYDNDGDLDLYVANDFGRNNLYRNEGGRFSDVAADAGVEDIGPGMSACWSDYDNDGWPDLYVSNMFSSAGNRITGQSRFQSTADSETREAFRRHARGNSLFRNLGNGAFADISEESGVVLGRWAWGSKFADLNNDGWQDLVVTNGFITQPDTGDL